MATEGGRISPPGRWGGLRPPPMARSILFFFPAGKSPEVAAGAVAVAGGGRLVAVSGGVHRRRWEGIIYLVA
jgi:hypothetical protein